MAAIIAAPEDDLPRLIYCDWLEEQGQGERAEFIRVQCELENAPRCTLPDLGNLNFYCDCHTCQLGHRQRDLLDAYGLHFLECFPFVGPKRVHHARTSPTTVSVMNEQYSRGYTFRRGFCESITCTWEDFARHADAIRKQTPLREVVLTTWPEEPMQQGATSYLTGDWPNWRYYFRENDADPSPGKVKMAEYPRITFVLPRGEARRANALAQARIGG